MYIFVSLLLRNIIPIIILIVVFDYSAFAQDDLKVQFTDGITDNPLPGVQLMLKGQKIRITDTNGIAFLPHGFKVEKHYLVAYKRGYTPDTFITKSLATKVHLYPLQQTLQEAIITNKKSAVLLKRGREYIFDYEFVGANILVASRIANTRKLTLVNNNGDILIEKKVDIAFNELYKSSVGEYYLVTYYSIYRLTFDYASKEIIIDKPKPLALLGQLKTCVLYKNDIYYYKLMNRQLRAVYFCLSKKDDPLLVPFRDFWQKDELLDLIDGKIQIQKYLEQGDLQSARILSSVMQLVDKNSFKKMNVPLFIKGDTILVFDLGEGYIHSYSSNGIFLKSQPLLFDYNDLRINKLVQDPVSERIYAYRSKPKEHILYGVDVEKGRFTEPIIKLEKPFAQIVKIKDDNIYYLWQNERQRGKQQLYIQRNK